MQPLFETIASAIAPASGDADGALQILVTNLDYSDYLGRLGIARVFGGTLKTGETVNIAKLDGSLMPVKITKLFSFNGLKRTDIEETTVGDIIAVAGVSGLTIGRPSPALRTPSRCRRSSSTSRPSRSSSR